MNLGVFLAAFLINAEHPRIFVTPETVPIVRERAATTHSVEWNVVRNEANNATPPTTGAWNQSLVRKYNPAFFNNALAYLVAGDVIYRDRLIQWFSICRSHEPIQFSQYGEDASWSGFLFAYSLLHDDPAFQPIRASVAEWFWLHVVNGMSILKNNPYKNYYKYPWIAGSCYITMLAIAGDVSKSDFDSRLAFLRTHVKNDFEARKNNYVGTYSGYRWERPWEDMSTALAWKTATNDEPFVDYANHLSNIGRWGMYATRGGWFESDEVGDGHDLSELHTTFVDFSLPTSDPEVLWWIDEATRAGKRGAAYWRLIAEDRTLPRRRPTSPLGHYFGDLTPYDGGNGRYAHMRSSFTYGDSVVVGTFVGPPYIPGHVPPSFGHIAMFRGSTIASASTGVYDGTAMPHFEYHSGPISENTILIQDPESAYGLTGGEQSLGDREDAPDIDTPTGPFHPDNEVGWIDRFASKGGVSYGHVDLTLVYPNTRKPSQWPNGAIVKNVDRSVMLVGGRFFVIFDRIETVRPSAQIGIVMHCPSPNGYELEEGAWIGGTPPNASGGTPGQWTDEKQYRWEREGTRVYATISTEEFTELWRIGGRSPSGLWNEPDSFEFFFNGRNIPYSRQYVSGAEERKVIDSGWAGFWRSEIRLVGKTSYAIPHVYELTATNRTRTLVMLLPQTSEDRIGIRIGGGSPHQVLVFSRDEQPDREAFYNLGLDSCENFVADLVPGNYSWATETEEGVFSVDASGTGLFYVHNGGMVRLAQGEDVPPPPPPDDDEEEEDPPPPPDDDEEEEDPPPPPIDVRKRFLTTAQWARTAYQWRIVEDPGPGLQGRWYAGPLSPGFQNGIAAQGDSISAPDVGNGWKYVIATWPAEQAGPDSVYRYEEEIR